MKGYKGKRRPSPLQRANAIKQMARINAKRKGMVDTEPTETEIRKEEADNDAFLVISLILTVLNS